MYTQPWPFDSSGVLASILLNTTLHKLIIIIIIITLCATGLHNKLHNSADVARNNVETGA